MTCLDTDFIIDLLRRKPAAESKLEELTADGDKLTTTPLNASFGKLSIELQRKGNNIGDFDLLITSIALTHGEPLLTKNAKHFSKVPGLAVENY